MRIAGTLSSNSGYRGLSAVAPIVVFFAIRPSALETQSSIPRIHSGSIADLSTPFPMTRAPRANMSRQVCLLMRRYESNDLRQEFGIRLAQTGKVHPDQWIGKQRGAEAVQYSASVGRQRVVSIFPAIPPDGFFETRFHREGFSTYVKRSKNISMTGNYSLMADGYDNRSCHCRKQFAGTRNIFSLTVT